MARPAPVHILIVDDEPEIRALLREYFELEGYGVSEAKDGAQMRSLLAVKPISLITLDISLPGEDGFALAQDIRAQRNLPIIMISGKQDPIDRIVALEMGADDYITKPFLLREVLARVRAVLRRYQREEGVAGPLSGDDKEFGFRFDGLELHVRQREVVRADGERIELTAAEFNLLKLFLERPSRVMTRDNIMDLMKGHDWSPFDRSIDTLVARLRKKIEPDSEHPRLIKTVRGVGYVLACDVQQM